MLYFHLPKLGHYPLLFSIEMFGLMGIKSKNNITQLFSYVTEAFQENKDYNVKLLSTIKPLSLVAELFPVKKGF